jgi:hypothetical protein
MATAVASTSHGQGTGVVVQPQVDWQICQRCAKKCKGARGLVQHKKACDRREALRVQQLQGHGGNGHARRPLLAVLGPGTGISGLQYAICHSENLAICHMLFQILTYMQYANGISRGSVRKVPGRASFRVGRTAKYQPVAPQPCAPLIWKTQIGSGE